MRIPFAAALEALSAGEPAPGSKPSDDAAVLTAPAAMAGQQGQSEQVAEGESVRVFERKEAVLFDTESKGRLIHRQLVTK
jgi:hypothetical protein